MVLPNFALSKIHPLLTYIRSERGALTQHPRKGGIKMTQMGLDYLKHRESVRHNQADETLKSRSIDVDSRKADIAQQEADTKQFVASFTPREVAAKEKQADAAKSQADTAFGRLALDSEYREREMKVKEKQADASEMQAEASKSQALIADVKTAHQIQQDRQELINDTRNSLAKVYPAYSVVYNEKINQGATQLEALASAFNAAISSLIPTISIRR